MPFEQLDTGDNEPQSLSCPSPASEAVPSSQLNRESLQQAGVVDAATLQNSSDEALKKVVDHETLKYHLLGPSLTKAGQDTVDQQKVSEIIYNASKGSKFFNNEESKDHNLTEKITRILERQRLLFEGQGAVDLGREKRKADEYVKGLEASRDLSQIVVHIDCDAFYAAVEELDRPELRDVPMAVGKGVLTTCNYHARRFGCRSGMAGFVAQKLCPQLISLPLNFDKYIAKANEVRAILRQYDSRFESASMDEAYMNLTSYCAEHNSDPEEAVTQMRAQVKEECKITISAGIAANARLAKICSNRNKPNGQFHLPSDRSKIMRFMDKLPTRKVNGIGRVFERELDAIGVKTCGDIYKHRAVLAKLLGEKAFHFLIAVYLGLGKTRIQPAEDYERKSVGTESTFHDMSSKVALQEKLRRTAVELEGDLKRTQFKGRTLVLKIKLHTYEVFTRQVAPPMAVSKADDLYKYSLPMLEKLWKEIPGMTLRLMGLRCTHLVSTQKADVDEFFGLAGRAMGSNARNAGAEDDEWEEWPESEFDAPRDTPDAETIDPTKPLPTRKEPGANKENEALWLCPICGHSLPSSRGNDAVNAHVDFCLSKQTIVEAIKETETPPLNPPEETGPSERHMSRSAQPPLPSSRKRGRPPRNSDEKLTEAARGTKKLFFA